MVARTTFDPSDLTATQKANAQKIIDVGVSVGASQRDIGIALATAKRESDLLNVTKPDRYGSVGLFQDRADDAPGAYIHGSPPYGYGNMSDLTADGGVKSIYNFYLGAHDQKSGRGVGSDGSGFSRGLLTQANRDDLDWAKVASVTQGFAPENYPYYQEGSENGQFARAALSGQIDGINPSAAQAMPQTGGVVYDRASIGEVVDKRSVQMRVPNRPPSIWDDPSTWQPLAQTNTPTPEPSAMPTISSEKTAAPQAPTAAPMSHGGGPNPISAIPGAAAIAHQVANIPGFDTAANIGKNILEEPIKAPIQAYNAADSLVHKAGGVLSSIGHAAGNLLSTGPLNGPVGGGYTPQPTRQVDPPDSYVPGRPISEWAKSGIDWGQVPEGQRVIDNLGEGNQYAGNTNVRQLEQAAFLPQHTQEEFSVRSLPLNGIVPSPTSAPLGPMGQETNNLRDAIAVQAHQWLGIDYQWGGKDRSQGGIDCSGLVMGILKAVGIDAGDPENTNAEMLGQLGPLTHNPQVGDLVAWDEGNSFNKNGGGADHIGIYMGNGYIAEAPRTGIKSRIRKLGENFDTKNKMWFVDMTKYEGKGTVPPEHIPDHEIRPQSVLPIEAAKDIGHLVGKATDAALHAAEKIPGIGGGIKDAADAVGAAGHAIGDPVQSFVHDSEMALGGAIREVGGDAADVASAVGHTLEKGAENWGGAIAAPFKAAGGEAAQIGGRLADLGNYEKGVWGGVIHHPIDALQEAWNETGGRIGDAAKTVAEHPLQALRGVGTELFEDPNSFKVGRRVVGSVMPGLANNIANGIEHAGGQVLNTAPGQWVEHNVLDPVGHALAAPINAAVDGTGHLLANAVGAVPGGDTVVHGAQAVGHALTDFSHHISLGLGGGGGGGGGSAPAADGGNGFAALDAARDQLAQRQSAEQADRGLQNRANDIYGQQQPAVFYRPVTAAVSGGGGGPGAAGGPTRGGDFAGGVTSERQAAQIAADQLAAAQQADRGLENRAQSISAAQAAAQQAALMQSINQSIAQMHQLNASITAQNAASSAAYYSAANTARAATPAYTPTVTHVGTNGTSVSAGPSYSQTPSQTYQANFQAYTAPPPTVPYSTGGGYGLSTPSTQAMSTGLDKYSDSRDYYYSHAGGGGTSSGAVGVQEKGWSDARDAAQAQQERDAQMLAHPSDARDSHYAGGF